MKKIILLLMTFTAYADNTSSIEIFCSKNTTETFRVTANNSLNVREHPSIESKKVNSLLEKQQVRIKSGCGAKEVVADKFGRWLNIEDGGFIFSAFVEQIKNTKQISKTPIPTSTPKTKLEPKREIIRNTDAPKASFVKVIQNWRNKLIKRNKINRELLVFVEIKARHGDADDTGLKREIKSIDSEVKFLPKYNLVVSKLNENKQKYGFKYIKCLEENFNLSHLNDNKEAMNSDEEINNDIKNEIKEFYSDFSNDRWNRVKSHIISTGSNYRKKVGECAKQNEKIKASMRLYKLTN